MTIKKPSKDDYTLSICTKQNQNTISTREVDYFDNAAHWVSITTSGRYTINFEILKNGVSQSKTSASLQVIGLRADFASTFPSSGQIGERLTLEVNHNFYSFERGRVEITWDFGDGQPEEVETNGQTFVSYPTGGNYTVSCTLTSIRTGNSLSLTRQIKIFIPITNPLIVAPAIAVGQIARVQFILGVEAGMPVNITADYQNGVTRDYILEDRSIFFFHTFQSFGRHTIKFNFSNPAGEVLRRAFNLSAYILQIRLVIRAPNSADINLKAFLREHDLHIVSEMPDFSFSTDIDFDNLSSIRNNLISISWENAGEEWDEEKYGLINFEWKVEKRNIRNFELISTVLTEHPIIEAEMVFPEVQEQVKFFFTVCQFNRLKLIKVNTEPIKRTIVWW